jgi:3D (Asp-Asp-Asp) domain-containing protein
MSYRIDPDWTPSRPRGRRGRAPAFALGVAAALALGWAWTPRAAVQAAAVPPASGLVAEAVAAPVAAREEERPAFPIVAEHEMSSTAYCLKGKTRTGVRTRDGLAAADPDFLPLGSVVRLSFRDGSPLGVFVIMDTGGAVKGKKIDIYMDSCREASRWGRKKVLAEVLDLGRELEASSAK